MMAVLEEVQQQIDRVEQLDRLKSQVAEFETRYGWTSKEFYPRFERGELGDDTDFFEWSATIEMIRNLQHAVESLE